MPQKSFRFVEIKSCKSFQFGDELMSSAPIVELISRSENCSGRSGPSTLIVELISRSENCSGRSGLLELEFRSLTESVHRYTRLSENGFLSTAAAQRSTRVLPLQIHMDSLDGRVLGQQALAAPIRG